MIGKTIGNCRVLEKIGEGGMGVVYKAEQLSLGRKVAMKVLPEHLTRDTSFVERFMNEARTIAALNHPDIVQIYDVGNEGEIYYYTMELIDGSPLDSILLRKGRLPPKRAISIVGKVAKALEYAHKQGIVHRDVKSSNIMMDSLGGIKLTDFGLALQERAKRLTVEGGIVGTPEYMAPEQAAGETAAKLSDIYSLGVVFYEMVTGRVPFEADTPLGVLKKVQTEEPVYPRAVNPEIPPGVEKMILKMMAKKPNRRHQNCRAVLADLRRCRTGEPVQLRLSDILDTLSARRLATGAMAILLLVALTRGPCVPWDVGSFRAFLPAACGGNPENARKRLTKLNIPYTAEEFINYAKRGDALAVKLFLAAGMSPNAKNPLGSTALMMAAREGHTDIMRILLDKGADMNAMDEDGFTALRYAMKEHRTDSMQILVENGVDVTTVVRQVQRYPLGFTPMMEAAYKGQTQIVKDLLNKGANVNASSRGGSTALTFAAEKGHTDIVKALLEKGADVNAKDGGQGRTALINAIVAHHTDIVNMLLKNGADVNLKDDLGKTALMYAAGGCDHGIAKALLDRGADISEEQNGGWTALKMARVMGCADVVQLLKEAGAKE